GLRAGVAAPRGAAGPPGPAASGRAGNPGAEGPVMSRAAGTKYADDLGRVVGVVREYGPLTTGEVAGRVCLNGRRGPHVDHLLWYAWLHSDSLTFTWRKHERLWSKKE